MGSEGEASTASGAPARDALLRGFLIRLLYGTLGVAVVVVIRPDFLGQNLHLLVGTAAAYLLVCLAGAAFDASGTKGSRMPSPPKASAARALSLAAFATAILLLWLSRS